MNFTLCCSGQGEEKIKKANNNNNTKIYFLTNRLFNNVKKLLVILDYLNLEIT